MELKGQGTRCVFSPTIYFEGGVRGPYNDDPGGLQKQKGKEWTPPTGTPENAALSLQPFETYVQFLSYRTHYKFALC